jgi:hypothetical protein
VWIKTITPFPEFAKLDQGVQEHVFSFLEYEDLVAVMCCSKKLAKLSSNADLWAWQIKKLLHGPLEKVFPEDEEIPERPSQTTWKEIHQSGLGHAADHSDRSWKIFMEILTTEETYVRGLRKAKEVLTQINALVDVDPTVVELLSLLSRVLSASEGYLEVLRHWEQLLFLDKTCFYLFARDCKKFLLANTPIYLNYTLLYDEAVEILRRPEYKEYDGPFTDSDFPGLRIVDLIIMPVRRVPRYSLLFRDWMKYVPQESQKLCLGEAVQASEVSAASINRFVC